MPTGTRRLLRTATRHLGALTCLGALGTLRPDVPVSSANWGCDWRPQTDGWHVGIDPEITEQRTPHCSPPKYQSLPSSTPLVSSEHSAIGTTAHSMWPVLAGALGSVRVKFLNPTLRIPSPVTSCMCSSRRHSSAQTTDRICVRRSSGHLLFSSARNRAALRRVEPLSLKESVKSSPLSHRSPLRVRD